MKQLGIKAALLLVGAVIVVGLWHYTVGRAIRNREIAARTEFVEDSVARVVKTLNDSIAAEAEIRAGLEEEIVSLEARQAEDSARAVEAGRRAHRAESRLGRHLEEEGDTAGLAQLAELRAEHAEQVDALESRADSLRSLVFLERDRAATFERERDLEREKNAALDASIAALHDQIDALNSELHPNFGRKLLGKLDDLAIAGAAFWLGTQLDRK